MLRMTITVVMMTQLVIITTTTIPKDNLTS